MNNGQWIMDNYREPKEKRIGWEVTLFTFFSLKAVQSGLGGFHQRGTALLRRGFKPN